VSSALRAILLISPADQNFGQQVRFEAIAAAMLRNQGCPKGGEPQIAPSEPCRATDRYAERYVRRGNDASWPVSAR
jgi:hypothetical protein